jgi:hypothetical protein
MQNEQRISQARLRHSEGAVKGVGQLKTRRAPAALPNGQEMKQTFLIFDGAADIMTSRTWAKIQHPFVGSIDFKGGIPAYKDIRDLTEIVVTEKK